MLDLVVLELSGDDVEDLDGLGVRRVDNSEDVRAETNVPLVEELDSEALVLWTRDQLALIGVDVEVLGGVNQSEVLGTLNNEEDNILDVEDERRSPVGHVVDVALRGGADDEVPVVHAHVDHSFSEVQIVVHLVQAVVDADSVLLVESSLDVSPAQLSIDDVAEEDMAIAASSSHSGAIVTPAKRHNRAYSGLLEAMRPATPVTKSDHLEGSDCKVVSVGSPLDAGDHVVVGLRVVQLTTELVPNAIFAVLSARDDQVVRWVPVASKDNAVVSLPLELLVTSKGRNDGQVLVLSVKNAVVLWVPANTIDAFAAIQNL